MIAIMMWTINDFPAYDMFSGWSTRGRFACPQGIILKHVWTEELVVLLSSKVLAS